MRRDCFQVDQRRPREHPEESVERTEFRSGVLALQNRELLSERQVLQEEDLTRMKEANEHQARAGRSRT
jgi:hypothetical protein